MEKAIVDIHTKLTRFSFFHIRKMNPAYSFLFIEQIETGLTHHLFSLITDFHFQTFSIVHRTKYRRINHHFLQYIIAVIRLHQSQAFIVRYRLSSNLSDTENPHTYDSYDSIILHNPIPPLLYPWHLKLQKDSIALHK